ncbi:Rhodanese-like protein [Martensiomyces pterosporus]|nr:Rhodanese-like protein [Martensiomyces pterosporus]
MQARSISFEQLHDIATSQAPRQKHTIVDIRTPEEFADGNVQSSYNLPIADIPEALTLPAGEFECLYGFALPEANSETQLVIYCRSGNRTRKAEDLLAQAGYTENLVSYYPGWLEYSQKA